MLKLKSFLFWLNCLLPIGLIASYFLPLLTLYEWGEQIGRAALVLLWLVLLPGIIKRLELKGKIGKLGTNLRIVRRQLGILIFQLGFIHYCWMVLFFYTKRGFPTDPSVIPQYQTFGLLALVLFLPLYITSNNFSTKQLKKAWFWLHRLVYISALLLLFHVGFNARISGYFFGSVTGVILLLEVISWGKYFLKGSKKKAESAS